MELSLAILPKTMPSRGAPTPLPVRFFHMPKTGGSSMESALAWYGASNGLTYEACYMWLVTVNDSSCTPADRLPGAGQVAFGHFLTSGGHRGGHGGLQGGSHLLKHFPLPRAPGAPRGTPPPLRATFIRHPVDYHVSVFFYGEVAPKSPGCHNYAVRHRPENATHAPNCSTDGGWEGKALPTFDEVFSPHQHEWGSIWRHAQWMANLGASSLHHDGPNCTVDTAARVLAQAWELVGATELFDATMLIWSERLHARTPLHYERASQSINAFSGNMHVADRAKAWTVRYASQLAELRARVETELDHEPTPDLCLWRAATQHVRSEMQSLGIDEARLTEYRAANERWRKTIQASTYPAATRGHVLEWLKNRSKPHSTANVLDVQLYHTWLLNPQYAPGRILRPSCNFCLP